MGSGLINFAIGLGEGAKYAAPFVKQQQEAEDQAARDERVAKIQAARDATLARLKEEADVRGEDRRIANIQRTQAAELPGAMELARGKADIEVNTANRKPQTVSEGGTLFREGQEPFTAPKTPAPKTQDELNEIKARAKLLDAQADYWSGAKANEAQARADRLAAGGEGKPIGPLIISVKGENGDYLVDKNSGSVGVIIPGEKGKPAKSNWFTADEPATPDKLQRTIWSTADGQPLPGGPFSLYKQLPVNAGGGARSAAPEARSGWDTATGDVYVAGKKVGTVDPKSPTARAEAEALAKQPIAPKPGLVNASIGAPTNPAVQPIETPQTPDIQGGPEVDAARARLASAKAKMQSFGLMARRKNPSGFNAATAEVDVAQMALNAAMATYSSNVRPEAARFNVK